MNFAENFEGGFVMKSARKFAFPGLVLAAALLAAGPVAAQAYPSKPIRAITPSAAGTGPDVIVRAVAGGLAKVLGQPLVVENRPGASGIIGIEQCVRAAPVFSK